MIVPKIRKRLKNKDDDTNRNRTELVSRSTVVGAISDDTAFALFRTIALEGGDSGTEILLSRTNLSRSQYYSKIADLIKAGLVKRKNGKSGEHSILICPDLISKKIYSHCCKIWLEEKNEIVLLLLTANHESVVSLINYLMEIDFDVKKYRKSDSLIIINSPEKFFGSPGSFFLDITEKQVTRKSKNGISIIYFIGPFNHLSNIKEIIDCEIFVTRTSDIKPASSLYGYNVRDFNMLTEDQKEILFEQHHKN
jgi:hypothetical protein